MSDFTSLDRMAASQYGLLTRQQLLGLGWSRGQIYSRGKSGLIVPRQKGVFAMAGAPATWNQLVCAASLASQPLGAASHRSASRLWGFRSFDAEIEVAIRYPRCLDLTDAIVHRSVDLTPHDITWVDGIPTTTPVRTICDLGLIFPRSEVDRIARHAIATGVVGRQDLWSIRYRNSKQGRNGVGVLEKVLSELPAHAEETESGIEVLFLKMVERFGLEAPSRQVPVQVAGKLYRLDFAYVAQKVFIETDGVDSHTGQTQIANDDGRQNALVATGWTPLRYTSAQLKQNPAAEARSLRSLLQLRGSAPAFL